MADLNTIWTAEDTAAVAPATDGDNNYSGSNNGGVVDNLHGGPGDDTINAQNGSDFVYGGAGDDALYGGNGQDTLYGGSGDDTLYGGTGNDTLIGGKDDDTLYGEQGTNTFVFRFEVTVTEGETYYFRPNDDGTGGDTPNANANPEAWANYLAQLEAWRAEMEAQYGSDYDMTDESVTLTNKKWGGDTYEYDNSFTTGGVSIEGEGDDRVMDWTAGEDNVLRLEGITEEQFELYAVWGDDGSGNLKLTLGDSSITFLGGVTQEMVTSAIVWA